MITNKSGVLSGFGTIIEYQLFRHSLMLGEKNKHAVKGTKESGNTSGQTTIPPKQAQLKRVKTVQCYEYSLGGLADLLFTFVDDSTLQGLSREMNKTVDVSKPLKKITTTIDEEDNWVYMIEFIFEDGSYQRMGKENPYVKSARGRS